MYKVTLTITVILAQILFVSAQNFPEIKWQDQEILTDGSNTEWGNPLNYYDSNTGLTYSISNDSVNLYLAFMTKNESVMGKMIRAGWKIELLSKEKRDKSNSTINFPELIGLELLGKINSKGNLNYEELVYAYKLNSENITIEGFNTYPELIMLSGNKKVQLAIEIEKTHNIFCEIKIPLEELFTENDFSFTEKMQMKVTVNKINGSPNEKEMVQGSIRGSSQGGSRGKGQGGGQGRGQGRGQEGMSSSGNSNNQQRNVMFEEIRFNHKFSLSKSN